MRLLLPGLALSILILLSTGCGNRDKPKTLVLGHAMHLAHPVSEAMAKMAEEVERLSDGKLNIEIYPSAQLGGERQLMELVQIGAVDITKVSGASLGNFVPEIRVLSLPYLFGSSEHAASVFWGEASDVGEGLLETGSKYNLKGIAYYDAGSRSFYTRNTRVTKPEDLEGLKIRVQPSNMATRLIKSLDASPTPIPYGELYTALQSGIVDAAENNPPSFHTARHYEVCEYYIIDRHTTIPDLLVINPTTWNRLSDEEKEWVTKAKETSVAYQRELWNKAVDEAFKVVEEAGVEVIYPDVIPFREMTKPMYEEFKRNNPEIYKWVEKIQQSETISNP